MCVQSCIYPPFSPSRRCSKVPVMTTPLPLPQRRENEDFIAAIKNRRSFARGREHSGHRVSPDSSFSDTRPHRGGDLKTVTEGSRPTRQAFTLTCKMSLKAEMPLRPHRLRFKGMSASSNRVVHSDPVSLILDAKITPLGTVTR